jgi:glycine/D-amino acid oxidase-like deaminating enzyme
MRTRVTEIQQNADSITLVTEGGHYQTDRLIMTVGAWAGQLLGLDVPLTVTRKHLHWFRISDQSPPSSESMPTFLFEMPKGVFYGIPGPDGTLKVAEHSGGEAIQEPAKLSRDVDLADLQRIEEFLHTACRFPICEHTAHDVCMYTLTPDGHFILDRHPQHSRIVFAAGLSGHGFKFTPVLGEALADLALDGRTELPIGHLSYARFHPKTP